jgi:hypothetical protein
MYRASQAYIYVKKIVARKIFYALPEVVRFWQTTLCFGRQMPCFLISTPFELVKNGFLPFKSGSLRMGTPHFYGLISVGLGVKEIFFKKSWTLVNDNANV